MKVQSEKISYLKQLIVKTIIAAAFLLIGNGIIAQPPPPPAGHGEGGNQPAGGTGSLTGGIGILLALGAAYGGRKIYKLKQQQEDEN